MGYHLAWFLGRHADLLRVVVIQLAAEPVLRLYGEVRFLVTLARRK